MDEMLKKLHENKVRMEISPLIKPDLVMLKFSKDVFGGDSVENETLFRVDGVYGSLEKELERFLRYYESLVEVMDEGD